MASFDHFTNEKSSVFEDADYDPDLEARLYAEIYYSNESYEQDCASTVKQPPHLATHLKPTTSATEPNRLHWNRKNIVNTSNPNNVSEANNSADQRSFYPSRSWVFGERSKNACSSFGLPSVRPRIVKQQRLLAHKGLWLPRVESEAPRHFIKAASFTPVVSRSIEAGNFTQALNRSNEAANSSTQLETRLYETENITPDVTHSNEVASTSPQFGTQSIKAKNFTPVVTRCNETANSSTQFGTRSIEAGNFTQVLPYSNEAANTSTRFGTQLIKAKNFTPVVTRFNEAANTSTQFGTRSIEAGNFTSVVTHSNEAANTFTQFGTRSVEAENITQSLTRSKEAANTSTQFGTRSIEAENITQALTRSDEAANTLPQFGIRSIEAGNFTQVLTHSSRAANTSRQFGIRSIEAENITQALTRSNEAANTSIRFGTQSNKARNFTPVVIDSNKALNTSTHFGTRSIEAENITAALTRSKEAANTSTQFGTRSNKAGSFVPVATHFNEGAKTSTQFRARLIEAENIDRVVGGSNRATNVSTQFGARSIELENITPVLGGWNRAANIPTRLGTGLNKAQSITPVVGNSNQVVNIFSRFGNYLPNFSEIANLTNDIRSDCFGKLADSLTEKKTGKKEKQKKSKLLLKQQIQKQKLRKLSDAHISKYKVVSMRGKKKMKQTEPEPVDISSDSDDSILEVPVPPKPPPPVIQLHDSDDDCEKSRKSRSKKGKKLEETQEESIPSYNLDSDSSNDDESSDAPISEASPSNLQRILKESAKKAKNAEISVASIQLQDCEDDCGKSSKSRSKKCRKSAEEPREESMPSYNLEMCTNKEDENPATICETSPTNLQKILKDAAKKAKNAEISVAVFNSEDSNLILNCTEIQKSASSLEEIRRMRETVTGNPAHSDDSMTESEANNWVNIAAEQANSSRGNEGICSVEQTAVWDQLTQKNHTAMSNSFNEIAASSSEVNLPIQTGSKAMGGDFNVLGMNEVANARKRQKDADSSPFDDFNVPAVPEKRAKQNRKKSSREQSMTEYFFKPMSKELQAFYNNSWGGESLDVYEIQSRMPRNPNCWMILDADLQGPSSKRRRLCPRCKTDSHFGNRCPEKAKAPCCYMCGAKGHTESRCPHTMCLTCGRKYATYRPTCGYCSQLYCTMCRVGGHSCENCPDLWRRYHSTTTETLPIVPRDPANIMKPPQHLICCNCAKRGHDVTMCRQLRWSQHFPTPMNISSYTQGPMYEPSNRVRIQDRPHTTDFTYELRPNVQIHNPETSSVPIHAPSASRSFQKPNPVEAIEIIENHEVAPPSEPLIPPRPLTSAPEPLISLPQGRMVFQAGEIDHQKMIGWQKATTRLDTMKNVDLTGLLAGNLKPAFLIDWQKYFDFSVEIIEDNASGVFVTIQYKTSGIFKQFEKVIWQWLSRKDAEKTYLVYDKIPYGNVDILTVEMKMKLVLIRTVLQPAVLMKKITECDNSLRRTTANLKQSLTKRNRRRLVALKTISGFTMSRRCQLVASLYSGSWVEGGDTTLQLFRQTVRYLLNKAGKQIPLREYFQLVYLYNEIFTFHETEALTKALKKALAVSQQSASTDPQQEIVSSDSFKYPSAEVSGNSDASGEIEPREIKNRQVTEKNNSPASSIGEQQPKADKDSLEESLRILTNSDAVSASNSIPQSSAETLTPNDSSQDFAPIIDERTIQTPKGKSKNRKGVTGLLKDLTKRRRKLYRRSAQDAIKVADSSNVPRLREMAKVLKIKTNDGTIRTDDVQSLHYAITADLGCKNAIGVNFLGNNRMLRAFKGTRKQRQADKRGVCNDAYVKFLRTL